ncbi:MAG: hypothetical protein ABIH92_00710 [Nanoarchaeota archaeon]
MHKRGKMDDNLSEREEIAGWLYDDVITSIDEGFILGFLGYADENEQQANKLFEDEEGNLLMPEEVYELSPWEIEERNIHVFGHLHGI